MAGFEGIPDTGSNLNVEFTDLNINPPGNIALGFGGIGTNTSCLLPNCDVLIDGYTYKNVSEITESDSVIGCFSQKPERIVKVIKQSHLVTTLEETNKPYVIRKSVFGDCIPDKDVHLSGHHRIIMDQGEGFFVGVQTFKLQKDCCVERDVTTDEVEYYHIILENKHEGITVNGLAVESCIN